MKIHSFVTEILFFSIISLFFVIPPLFVNAPSVQHIDFTLISVQNFSHFVIAFFIFLFYKKSVENDEKLSSKILKYSFLNNKKSMPKHAIFNSLQQVIRLNL